MILEYLEKMRERPRHEQKRFVFLATIAITGVIAIVWLLTIPMRFSFSEFANMGDIDLEGVKGLSDINTDARSDLQQLIDAGQTIPGMLEEATEAEPYETPGDQSANLFDAIGVDTGGTDAPIQGNGQENMEEIREENIVVEETPPPEKRAVIIATTSREKTE
jgi:hypothetical protein